MGAQALIAHPQMRGFSRTLRIWMKLEVDPLFPPIGLTHLLNSVTYSDAAVDFFGAILAKLASFQ